jgi:hypothetical protein
MTQPKDVLFVVTDEHCADTMRWAGNSALSLSFFS